MSRQINQEKLIGNHPASQRSLKTNILPWKIVDYTSLLKEWSFQKDQKTICAMVKSRYIGDGHPTFNRNPFNGVL